MNVVTGSEDRLETCEVFILDRSLEEVWVYVIPVKAEEISFLTLTDGLKLFFWALSDWTELRVVLVRAYVMIKDLLELLSFFLAVNTEYPFHILFRVLEILCQEAFRRKGYPKVHLIQI